ncbi:MAG TPA: MFS transporter [Chitinophagaceae bacterium]|jgi:predicted MFS family arabinose efflux permease|nr:MFS transporter [Chitinophagaceae bacterium]
MIHSSLALYRNAYSGLSRSIWLQALVMFVNRSGTMVIPFMTVYLTHHLHYSIAQAGLVMAAYGAGSIVGAFAGGRISDRIGFYPVQFWSLLSNGIMFIVLGQMSQLWRIGLCIFIMSSVGESFRPANAAAIAAYSDETNRTRSYSLNRLAVNLGFSIGPAMGGFLSSISYHWLFWVDGITCIIAAMLLRTFLRPVKTGVTTLLHEREIKVSKKDSVFRDTVYLKFMFCVFLVAFCFLMVFSLVPVYYKDHVHMNESLIGVVLAMNGLIIALVEMILVYKLEGKRRSTFYISSGAFCIGMAYLALTIAPVRGIVILSMLIITLGEMLMFPFVNTYWVAKSKEHNRGQYASIYTISFSLANMLAPTIGSLIVNFFGFNILWYTATGICTIAAFSFYRFQEIKKA